MYCESKITDIYWGDVEHIRPKARFPDLEFVWENLGFVCAKCNNAKRDNWNDALPFIDPFTEDPSEHLVAVGSFIFHRHASQRGEFTWRLIELNRPQLVERRGERIKSIVTLLDKLAGTEDLELAGLIKKELEAAVADTEEYAMVCRAAHAILAPQATN
jgi:HNH endonuclease